MATVNPEMIAAPAQGFARLPAVRQIAMLVGLAASIALGFWVVLWSQTPSYQPLYGNLSNLEVGEIMEVLRQADIGFRLDEGTGTLLVPAADVHKARIRLATEGLPRSSAAGFEMMEKSQTFGTSQFMEAARYQRALEGELGRSIASLHNVKSARVHLAIPKQSSFIRPRKVPSASVVVTLFAGRQLGEDQLAGVVHLVSSSIPELAPDSVSVIDQRGRLLTAPQVDKSSGLSHEQFDYTARVEDTYVKRVENILSPIVGLGNVRAQVAADIDFTVTEQTSEVFDPDERQIRSEAVVKEQRTGSAWSGGVPGALSNQPPAGGVAPERIDAAITADELPEDDVERRETLSALPKSTVQRATHNYELDKTISHTRLSAGKIRRLSVAVVLDERTAAPSGAEATAQGYTPEDIERFTMLVKEAVGFDETRRDTVTVVAVPFTSPEPVEPLPSPPLWEQTWLYDGLKYLAAGIVILLLIFSVLRPTMQALAVRSGSPARLPGDRPQSEQGQEPESARQLAGAAPGQYQLPDVPAGNAYGNHLETARDLADKDPGRVAQVVKTWVSNNG